MWNELPNEVLEIIFIQLKSSDWFRVLNVCRRFYEVGVSVFNPSYNSHQFFRKASERGYLESIKYLLSDNRVDPSSNNENGHSEVVRVLLMNEQVRTKLKQEAHVFLCCIHYAQRNNQWKILRELQSFQSSQSPPRNKSNSLSKKKKKKPSSHLKDTSLSSSV